MGSVNREEVAGLPVVGKAGSGSNPGTVICSRLPCCFTGSSARDSRGGESVNNTSLPVGDAAAVGAGAGAGGGAGMGSGRAVAL